MHPLLDKRCEHSSVATPSQFELNLKLASLVGQGKKNMSPYMRLRWWSFVSRLVPTFLGDFKFKFKLELVGVCHIRVSRTLLELKLKLASLVGQRERIWTLTCAKDDGALVPPSFSSIKFEPTPELIVDWLETSTSSSPHLILKLCWLWWLRVQVWTWTWKLIQIKENANSKQH